VSVAKRILTGADSAPGLFVVDYRSYLSHNGFTIGRDKKRITRVMSL
jgi:hypothetical protein